MIHVDSVTYFVCILLTFYVSSSVGLIPGVGGLGSRGPSQSFRSTSQTCPEGRTSIARRLGGGTSHLPLVRPSNPTGGGSSSVGFPHVIFGCLDSPFYLFKY